MARGRVDGEAGWRGLRTLGLPAGRRFRRLPGAGHILSLWTLMAAWWLLSLLLSETVLPGPWTTVRLLVEEVTRGHLLHHLGVSLRRVAMAFTLAMGAGSAAGAAMGASRLVNGLLEGWMLVGLSLPRIVYIVLAYVLLGLNDRAAVAAVALSVAPSVAAQVRAATQAVDHGLVEMARAFRRSPAVVWVRVVTPQLLPHVLGAARGALSLAWKMVVFAELMGRTDGVGYQISFFFQMFDMGGILAYALATILVVALLDLGVLGTVERLAFRWRRPTWDREER
ncbi:ABC transporter permease [Limnochorda pilosa]|uniref:ABC transmembrane type-1 domain-containing protein n=1 Tax=Limnochorda pilosa TaxID=1555112 RepID=A0A0K2SIY1_LIMPI|nr:ABC transporter permease subunit [Limnochorda pilosa]BAS26987.1 hypothetical protein LIP_1130 [Limnochorda pilosa]